MPKLGANLDASGLKVVNLADPTAAQDAATKAYVDGLANGITWKEPARLGTYNDANWNTSASADYVTGTGVLTISSLAAGSTLGQLDGVEAANGDRILIKDFDTISALTTDGGGEATPTKYHGLWEVTGGTTTSLTLTRTADFDESSEVVANAAVFIEEGTNNGDTGWTLTTDNPITVNTDAQTWVQFTGVGSIIAGDALSKTGNQLDVNVDGVTIVVNGSDNLQVPNGGIDTAQLADDSVTALKLNADVAGLGLTQAAGGELDVNVDGVTLEIVTDTVQVADGGIGTTQLADDSVTAAKLNADTAGAGLVQNGGTGALDVNVDGVTIIVNGSDQLEVVDQFDDHKYQTDIGNGVDSSFNINHALNDANVLVQVFDNNTGVQCIVDVTIVDANNLTIAFDASIVPTANQFSVVVLG